MSIIIKDDLYGGLLNSYLDEVKALIEKKNQIISFLSTDNKSKIAIEKMQFLNTRVWDLHLTTREINCLRAANVKTLYDLVQWNKTDLLRIPNIGKSSVNGIQDFLFEHNLNFGMQDIDIINYCNE